MSTRIYLLNGAALAARNLFKLTADTSSVSSTCLLQILTLLLSFSTCSARRNWLCRSSSLRDTRSRTFLSLRLASLSASWWLRCSCSSSDSSSAMRASSFCMNFLPPLRALDSACSKRNWRSLTWISRFLRYLSEFSECSL